MLGIIGLMSGTSADGIDASFIRSDGKQLEATGQQLSFDYPVQVREEVYAARKMPQIIWPTRIGAKALFAVLQMPI